MNIVAKLLKERAANRMQLYIKKTVYYAQVEFARNVNWLNMQQSHNIMLHITRIKEKNHMIISMNADKELDKFQHLVKKTKQKTHTTVSKLGVDDGKFSV